MMNSTCDQYEDCFLTKQDQLCILRTFLICARRQDHNAHQAKNELQNAFTDQNLEVLEELNSSKLSI